MYWLVLFFVTMRRQIRHMVKYKYIPISFGKKVCQCVGMDWRAVCASGGCGRGEGAGEEAA